MTGIAHISTKLNSDTSTAAPAALARDQRGRGWQVEFVIGSNATSGLIGDREAPGFPVSPVPSLVKYPDPLKDLRALGRMVRLFQKNWFDVVHTPMAKVGILGRSAARPVGVKTIVFSVQGPSFPPTTDCKAIPQSYGPILVEPKRREPGGGAKDGASTFRGFLP
jgi:hypothetical protein